MNPAQKFVYILDKYTPLLKSVEVNRANEISNLFSMSKWFTENTKLLDIGTGVGDLTNKMTNYISHKVISLDVKDFRREGIKKQSNYLFLLGDIKKLPFKDGCFNCITLLWTLHHIHSPLQYFEEISRVLTKDGDIIILEDIVDKNNWLNKNFTKYYDKVINLEFKNHPHSNLSISEWTEAITSNHNFHIIESREIPYFKKFKILKFGLMRFRKK